MPTILIESPRLQARNPNSGRLAPSRSFLWFHRATQLQRAFYGHSQPAALRDTHSFAAPSGNCTCVNSAVHLHADSHRYTGRLRCCLLTADQRFVPAGVFDMLQDSQVCSEELALKVVFVGLMLLLIGRLILLVGLVMILCCLFMGPATQLRFMGSATRLRSVPYVSEGRLPSNQAAKQVAKELSLALQAIRISSQAYTMWC